MIDKHHEIFERMISRNIIPNEGMFEINFAMIDQFYEIYREVYPPKGGKMKSSNVKYAKKLAGLHLMKLSTSRAEIEAEVERKVKVKKPKCGIVYLISNPAFPGMYKISMTQDLDKRLESYQTADPFRKFKVEHYRFVEDRRSEEKRYLQELNTDIVNGEWVSTERSRELFKD